MVFNGSDLITQPFNTTMSPYTHLFGMAFFIIPVAFIGAALFVKTKDVALTSIYFIMMSVFLLGGSVYYNAPGASMVFAIVAILGLASLLFNVFYGGK
jgi:hypothetical protein